MGQESRSNKKKSLQEYKVTKPEIQMLFQLMEPAQGSRTEALRTEGSRAESRTLELYDFMPKYFWGKPQRPELNKLLDPVTRQFECRGMRYTLTIWPAHIRTHDGKNQQFFPSKREELVEDALRKLACNGNEHGCYLDDLASVKFTLRELQRELQEQGHTYNISEIKDSLNILLRTLLELASEDGQLTLQFHMIETLGLQNREQWLQEKCAVSFVRFNALVTKAITGLAFRQIDYAKSMAFKSTIARQIYKRLSHHYTQAAFDQVYTITLSTMIRDFGLTSYPDLRNNLRDVLKAFDELKECEVVWECATDRIREGRKLRDVRFSVKTTPNFNSTMKMHNGLDAKAHIPPYILPEVDQARAELRLAPKRKLINQKLFS